MMKLFAFFAVVFFLINCTSPKKSSKNNNALNGAWIPVKQEIGGHTLPTSSFEKQRLTIIDSNYTFEAESMDKGIVTRGGNKMDIYGREGVNAGKHFTAIYKLENDQLFICYNLKGDAYPTSFDTKAGVVFFLSVFKKEK